MSESMKNQGLEEVRVLRRIREAALETQCEVVIFLGLCDMSVRAFPSRINGHGLPLLRHRTSIRPAQNARLQVRAFKFLADLGLSKPSWLPSFKKVRASALLTNFRA